MQKDIVEGLNLNNWSELSETGFANVMQTGEFGNPEGFKMLARLNKPSPKINKFLRYREEDSSFASDDDSSELDLDDSLIISNDVDYVQTCSIESSSKIPTLLKYNINLSQYNNMTVCKIIWDTFSQVTKEERLKKVKDNIVVLTKYLDFLNNLKKNEHSHDCIIRSIEELLYETNITKQLKKKAVGKGLHNVKDFINLGVTVFINTNLKKILYYLKYNRTVILVRYYSNVYNQGHGLLMGSFEYDGEVIIYIYDSQRLININLDYEQKSGPIKKSKSINRPSPFREQFIKRKFYKTGNLDQRTKSLYELLQKMLSKNFIIYGKDDVIKFFESVNADDFYIYKIELDIADAISNLTLSPKKIKFKFNPYYVEKYES